MLRCSRLLAGTVVLATGYAVLSTHAWAQAVAPGGAAVAAAPQAASADTVVARVDGKDIRMSDIANAAQSLPEQMRGLTPSVLFPMLLDQLIDRQALVVQARKSGMTAQEDVKQAMEAAADRALQAIYLSREIGPLVNDDALRARYDRDIAGKPGAEEVHARHILVATEAAAKKIIADLKKGGDFAALARQHSTDPGGQQGGDLGFFKKDDMVPEFAAATFALKVGAITEAPVKTQFGYHVIKLEERRAGPAPSFEDTRDDLRQKLIQEVYQKLSQTARAAVTVERFNMDGSVPSPTDNAVPPPPAKPR